MAEAPFPFFRATFYRWIQFWPEVCPDLAKAPAVLAIGDLHVENFGTWRDEEGRLIWGVNDLDEAWPASYALDLVRLSTSAYLAISGEHLGLTRRDAAARSHKIDRSFLSPSREVPTNCGAASPDLAAWDIREFWPCRRGEGHLLPAKPKAFGLLPGLGAAAFHPKMFTARSWSTVLSASRTLSCVFTGTGLFGAWRRIVRASNSLPCPRKGMKRGFCTTWDGKPRTYISEAPLRLPK